MIFIIVYIVLYIYIYYNTKICFCKGVREKMNRGRK